MKTVTFDVEVKGSGVAGTAPEIGQALRGCGFGETIVGGVSVTYEPVSTGAESITMWRYLDGILEKFTGSRGEVSFNYETGNKIMASFSFTGHFASGADIAVASPSYNATLPVAILGASFVVGGYAAVINALSFAMTNTLAIAPDMNAADGFGEVNITKRDVQGSFDPETVLLAVNNFDTDFTGNVVMALATGALGGTAGNILNTSMPAIKYQSKAEGERDGVQTYDMGFKAAPSAGDDDVTLAFT